MKRLLLASVLALSSSFVSAGTENNQCLAEKYDMYIDASLNWYQDLVTLTSEKYPNLEEVGQWFLESRKHHFELNREAVHYFLVNNPSKVATEQSVEAWLKLEQKEIKELAMRDDDLGRTAARTFNDRQATAHAQNYELRSAFAELLSHPKQIDKALSRYNESIAKLETTTCQ